MDILDTLLKDLQTRRGDWPEIARDAQVSYSWLTKLAQGRIPDPSIRRVFRVRAVLDEYAMSVSDRRRHKAMKEA